MPGYNIGGNSELATSGPDNSSEKEVFSVLVEYSYSMKFYDKNATYDRQSCATMEPC